MGSLEAQHFVLFVFIENADATPPHLDVIVRLGSSVEMLCYLHFFALGLLSVSIARVEGSSFSSRRPTWRL